MPESSTVASLLRSANGQNEHLNIAFTQESLVMPGLDEIVDESRIIRFLQCRWNADISSSALQVAQLFENRRYHDGVMRDCHLVNVHHSALLTCRAIMYVMPWKCSVRYQHFVKSRWTTILRRAISRWILTTKTRLAEICSQRLVNGIFCLSTLPGQPVMLRIPERKWVICLRDSACLTRHNRY